MEKEQLSERKGPLIVLTGPTAVGKTALSVKLAKALDGEIISADSMQVYRHMDIGSAKVAAAETGGIRHHLIDVLEPEEEFNVVLFQKLAKEAIADIYSRGKTPVIVGGTGFYIQSVLYDIDFTQTGAVDCLPEEGRENSRVTIRDRLEKFALEKGAQKLHDMLERVDAKAAEQIHAHNVKRVIRALEYYFQTGEKISEHNEGQRQKEAAYDCRYFVLTDDREKLYGRIDRRVDQMLEQGLVEEVRALKKRGLTRETVSMQGLGYKEILGFLDGEYDLDRAVYLIKRDTRHFAKRQLTWFKREKNVIWVDRRQFAEENDILQFLIKESARLCRAEEDWDI